MSTPPTALRRLLTLPDIAALARVQRPVPSMWRARSANSDHPFPAAQLRSDTQEFFDANDVANWLEATGRGNNPHIRDELALFAAFGAANGIDRRAVFDGLTALLALKAATGEQFAGRTAADLLDLADDADPHDRRLYREIAALGDDLTTMAGYADAMASSAYTPAAAFEALMAHRFRFAIREYADTALTSVALDLVARLALALMDPERTGTTTFVDPSVGSDLLVALRAFVGDEELPTAAIGPSESTGARLAMRRLTTQGWQVVPLPVDSGGRLALPGETVLVAQYPSPDLMASSDAEVLAAIDDIALAMDDDDRAVVVGPATALANALTSRSVDGARAALLRTDRVRTIVRLPAGLRTAKPRQRLAIWVLGPAHPDVAIADRWITVADLSASTIDESTIADLVSDVVAAMGNRDTVRRHAFRFARFTPTSTLLASSGDLVGTPRPHLHLARQTPVDIAVHVHELIDEANTSRTARIPIDIEPREFASAQMITLGALVAAGKARLLPGNRFDASDLVPHGDVRVIGTDELLDARPLGERTLDRLTFSATYPAGRYTEPGDIVFCATPGVGALVDTAGLSAVMAPARVLRIDRNAQPGMVPDVVAHDIRRTDSTAGWRTWPVRLVPMGQSLALAEALQQIASERTAATRRIEVLDELASAVVDGVTNGSLSLNFTLVPDDDHVRQEG